MIDWLQGERKQKGPASQIQTKHSASIGVRVRLMCFANNLELVAHFFQGLVYLVFILPFSCIIFTLDRGVN